MKKFKEAKAFIDFDLPNYDPEQLVLDYEGLGDPRFVVKNSQMEDERVLDVSKISRRLIRQVVKQLGFEPIKPLEELKEEPKKVPEQLKVSSESSDDDLNQGSCNKPSSDFKTKEL